MVLKTEGDDESKTKDEQEDALKQWLTDLASPRPMGCSKITGKTKFTKEVSNIQSILKNKEKRAMLNDEEILALWINEKK